MTNTWLVLGFHKNWQIFREDKMKQFTLMSLVLVLSALSVSAIASVPPPADASQMQLKVGAEYKQVPLSDIVSIDIKVRSVDPSSDEWTERHFEGALASKVLKEVGLNAPSEPGLPSALTTGEIAIQLKDGVVRHLDILNERLVEDHDHYESIYKPLERLNLEWLKSFDQ